MTSTPPPTSGDSDSSATGPTRPRGREESGDPAAPLPAWIAEAAGRLDLDPAQVPVRLLLDLARDAAHGVARPAAPLTTFLAGLAAGRAGGSTADVEQAVQVLTELLTARA